MILFIIAIYTQLYRVAAICPIFYTYTDISYIKKKLLLTYTIIISYRNEKFLNTVKYPNVTKTMLYNIYLHTGVTLPQIT